MAKSQQHPVRHWLLFTLRWGIAVLGVWYVVRNISLHDRVQVVGPAGRPVSVELAAPAEESSRLFDIYTEDGMGRTVDRGQLVVHPDVDQVSVANSAGSIIKMDVLGVCVTDGVPYADWPLIVSPPRSLWQKFTGQTGGSVETIAPATLATPPLHGRLQTHPLIDVGLRAMVSRAWQSHPGWLLAAVLIFPLNFFITAERWLRIAAVLDIPLRFGRAFTIGMVGAFYNTFMPGSTGGDVLKAYYAAKQTPHRTRAVMSVLIDRVIGLFALVLLGGTMAAVEASLPSTAADVRHRCVQVAVGAGVLVLMTIAALAVLYVPIVRRLSGFDFFASKLPMQKQVRGALETMNLLARHPALLALMVAGSLPVHVCSVVSVSFACKALGLPLTWGYYWVIVPVIALAAALPVSPQGAGVMEFFAILLTAKQGCTVSQAFALTMSMRLLQIFWNLTGGIFVLRGGFHAPTEQEQDALAAGDVDAAPEPGLHASAAAPMASAIIGTT